MLQQLYANNASTTLASVVSPTDTILSVASSTAFPHPSANQYFRVTIDSGTGVEVIFVYGVAGNSFTGCVRGQEGTAAQSFQAGTVIECRATSGTFSQFARLQDRLAEITSVDNLTPPSNSDGNSYICLNGDDSGNPIVAIKKSSLLWRFTSHPTTIQSGGTAAGSTVTRLVLTSASTLVPLAVAGKYIIQFTTGANQGLTRAITVSDSTGLSWSTPLPNTPTAGDGFEIYQSTASSINNLTSASDRGLLFSILFSE